MPKKIFNIPNWVKDKSQNVWEMDKSKDIQTHGAKQRQEVSIRKGSEGRKENTELTNRETRHTRSADTGVVVAALCSSTVTRMWGVWKQGNLITGAVQLYGGVPLMANTCNTSRGAFSAPKQKSLFLYREN